MNETPIRHDYSNGTYSIGWAVLGFDFHAPGIVKFRAFGLKRHIEHSSLEEIYLLPGEEIVISMPDGEVLYEIITIRYHRDPYDMYEAELKYVQHLTGWGAIGQWDEKQRARIREWTQYKKATTDRS